MDELAAASAAVFATVLIGSLASSVFIRRRERRHVAELCRVNADLESRFALRTAELAASSARQRSTFEASPIGMFILRIGTDGSVLQEDMNPAAEAIYRRPRDTVLGRTLLESWPEDVANPVVMQILACARERRTVSYIADRDIDGTPHTLDVQLSPLPDATGEVRHVLSCVRDVTYKMRLEHRLRLEAERQAEAAERETALFHNSPDILFVLRVEEADDQPDFIHEAFSPALERLTGLQPARMVGHRPSDSLPPEMARALLPEYRRCLREGTTIGFSAQFPVPVGNREYEISLTPVRHAGTGRIVRIVGSARDATERNRLEFALRGAQRLEAIGRLAAGVAHDFNNILQAISGGLEIVLDEVATSSDAGEAASLALGSARRGGALTHHLLSYARQQMLQPKAILLDPFLGRLDTILTRTLGPQITVSLTVAPGTPPVLVDPAQLETALLNLALNARDAMPGGGRLDIAADEMEEDGKAYVVLQVRDAGAGMDAATLAQAMEPFFTTKGRHGTGLGLSMVQGFAEQSGGALTIRSLPGQGTQVALRLPASPVRPETIQPVPGCAGAGRRILVVDDESDVLVTACAFLRRSGFAVTQASGPEEALAALEQDPTFVTMVTDYAMPGLNGADLIARARLVRPGLPAVLITGFVGLVPLEMAAAGAVVLHKPFPRDALVAAVAQVTRRVGVRQPALV